MKRIIMLILALLLCCTSCSWDHTPEESREDSTEISEPVEEESEVTETVIVPKKGGTLYLNIENETVYNPILETQESVSQMLNLIYSPLIDYDENGKALPSIASGWTLSEDNLQAVLTINTDIQWHNGKMVTPGDVVYTIQILQQVEESVYKDCVSNIESANVIDDKTIQILFKEPSGLNLNKLYFPVISREYYNGTLEDMLGHATEPMGSGPYRFESYIPMKEMVLTANEEYHGQIPYIEKVVIRLSYSDVRQESFNQKLTNIVYLEDINWGDYLGRENVNLHIFSSNDTVLLKYNMDTVDLNTRKAIAYALDSGAILATTYLDKGDVTEVPISPRYWYAPTNPSLYGYSLEKVSELLDLSEEMELRLLVNKENALLVDIADAVKESLEAQGILVTIVTKSHSHCEEMLEKGDYDIALISENIVDLEDLKELLGGTSESMDRLLEEAEIPHAEHEVHQALASVSQKMIDEMPYYSMFVLKEATLTGIGVQGQLTPNPYNVYRGIENLYIEYTEE